MPQRHEISVDYGVRKFLARRQVVRKSNMRKPVFGIRFLQLLARNHNGNGRFGDKVVRERSQENTEDTSISIMNLRIRRLHLTLLEHCGLESRE